MSTPRNSPSYRILVVDDNPAIHGDFRKILCPAQSQADSEVASLEMEMFGSQAQATAPGAFEMDSAFQGQEALAKVLAAEAEGQPYSLAFMDVRMPPGWDGVETIAQIWKQHPAIQIVICTAYSDYSWSEILTKLGETDSLVILKKPFDNVEVLQLAHTLTKKWTVTRLAAGRMADLDQAVKQRTQELIEANQQLQSEIHRRADIEAALRESEERFRKAFETVTVALVIYRADDHRCVDINQGFLTLCGRTREELLGRTPAELDLPAEPTQGRDLMAAFQAGATVQNAGLSVKRKNGEIRHTLFSAESLMLGQQRCVLCALLDVTDQKQLEIQLRQAQKMEAIGQLAAGVAHDFNNLLTVIRGYSSLQLARANLDAGVTKAFTQVKMASDRASALTRQLLAFSRKQVVQRRNVDLGATMMNLQKMLARMVGETIQIECHCPASLPTVYADETNLDQIIINLVLNARDAMPQGGKISIAAGHSVISEVEAAGQPDWRAGHVVILTITDTGCGMDEKTLARIFEPFFTTKPIGHGTGLGLSTVYGIVKQHEGWVQVESRPNQGTTFRVFLPIWTNQPTADEPVEPPASPNCAKPAPATPAPRGKVLVVEDEPDLRDYVVSVLTQHGYQVEEAASGAEALERWKAIPGPVRLLLTDMVMPGGVSGRLLARSFLRHHPEMRVIYTSGYGPETIPDGESVQEGVNFLSKPFTYDCLLATVERALSTPAESDELPTATTTVAC